MKALLETLIIFPFEVILDIIGELILQPLLIMLLESLSPVLIFIIKFFGILLFIVAFFCIISGNGCAVVIGGIILIPVGIIALIVWFLL